MSGGTTSAVLDRLERAALGLGGVFLLALAGAAADRAQFFRSYLYGYLFWVLVGVGSLGLAMLSHLTGGLWGLVPRRLHEAAARTLPAMGLAFVPVVLGASSIYTWANPEVVAADALLREKSAYLNVPFFTLRGALLRGWARLPGGSARGRGSRTSSTRRAAPRACAACRRSGWCCCS
jgi:hypothetical protein